MYIDINVIIIIINWYRQFENFTDEFYWFRIF